jgi:hypothetical protein
VEIVLLFALAPSIFVLILTVVTAVDAAKFHAEEYVATSQAPELRITFLLVPVAGMIIIPAGLAVSCWYWIGVRPKLDRARRRERAIPDNVWLSAGRDRFAQTVGQYAASPEDAVAAGHDQQRSGDRAAALVFYQEAIERLHTLYVTERMTTRRPTIEDSRVIMPYLAALDSAQHLSRTGSAVFLARRAAWHLVGIVDACRNVGHDASVYRSALDRLATHTKSDLAPAWS